MTANEEMRLMIANQLLDIEGLLKSEYGHFFDNHRFTLVLRVDKDPKKHVVISNDSTEFQTALIKVIENM